MNIAQGSLEECRYYIILSKDLSYIDSDNYNCLMIKLEGDKKGDSRFAPLGR